MGRDRKREKIDREVGATEGLNLIADGGQGWRGKPELELWEV